MQQTYHLPISSWQCLPYICKVPYQPTHEDFMQRCLQLAALAKGSVEPNPLVGSVLVHEQRIIGEGYHQAFGLAHAEVACLQSVTEQDRYLIPESTLYVSLEPCAHFGKTPPCVQRILSENIKKVVVAGLDPNPLVNGKGIQLLQQAGVSVITGILQNEAETLNKAFYTFYRQHRPFITLKWAVSADGFIAGTLSQPRVFLTGPVANRWVHQLRATHRAIAVGYNTALYDDPMLTVRYGVGRSPMKIVFDSRAALPAHLKIFDDPNNVIVFSKVHNTHPKAGKQILVSENMIGDSLAWLYQNGIQSILVEGGRSTLQEFINQGVWDEVQELVCTKHTLGKGLKAPVLYNQQLLQSFWLGPDRVNQYLPILE